MIKFKVHYSTSITTITSNSTLYSFDFQEDGRILSNYDNEIATLSIDHVTEQDAGVYVCTAINEAGSAKSECNLIVIGWLLGIRKDLELGQGTDCIVGGAGRDWVWGR